MTKTVRGHAVRAGRWVWFCAFVHTHRQTRVFDTAKRVADCFIQHLTNDFVPRSDLNAPESLLYMMLRRRFWLRVQCLKLLKIR